MIRHCAHGAFADRGWRNLVVALSVLVSTVLTDHGGTAMAADHTDVRRVGILSISRVTNSPAKETWFEFFRRNLADQGWVDGEKVSFELRNAQSDSMRFTEAAAELVALDVDVIFATSAPALRAAYAATRTIPIVGWDFTTDPIAEGYVESYSRPRGNVTGVFLDAPELAGKWFEFLKAMVPGLSRVAVFWDPVPGETHLQAVRSVADSLGIDLQIVEASNPDNVDKAFATLESQTQALIFLPSPMIYQESARLASLAFERHLPAISMAGAFANAGGTLAYGPELISTVESNAMLVGKILSGAEPGELPVERPAMIHLVVNLKTAHALGITVPQSIMLRADEVIR